MSPFRRAALWMADRHDYGDSPYGLLERAINAAFWEGVILAVVVLELIHLLMWGLEELL